MPTNFYFQNGLTSGTSSEQLLIESLVIESLKIYGHDLYYMPRTSVNEDEILTEDSLSQFTQAYPLEMYLENVNGYDGEGDIFSKFGIEVRDQATFVLARRRWDEMVQTSGGEFQLDARPAEGDLLYFEKTKSLFEIKKVEFQDPFYQAGKLYVYKLICELYEYSSENIDTGITDIDNVEKELSLDSLEFQILQEDGTALLMEYGGGTWINEAYSNIKQNYSDNSDLINVNNLENILDFTESNPFGEL